MIINLTPHTVNLIVNGKPLTIERKGRIPRVEEIIEYQTQADGVYIYGITYGGVIDAPPMLPDTYYVVSRMIAEALPGREDLLFPMMLKKDSDGKVISANALGRIIRSNNYIPPQHRNPNTEVI